MSASRSRCTSGAASPCWSATAAASAPAALVASPRRAAGTSTKNSVKRRIDDDRGEVEVLADDLVVHLAGRRDVDDDVAHGCGRRSRAGCRVPAGGCRGSRPRSPPAGRAHRRWRRSATWRTGRRSASPGSGRRSPARRTPCRGRPRAGGQPPARWCRRRPCLPAPTG